MGHLCDAKRRLLAEKGAAVMFDPRAAYPRPVLTKAQRQAQSRAAELDRPRREAAKRAEAEEIHAAAYSDVIEALEKAGIDPVRLREWLDGPR